MKDLTPIEPVKAVYIGKQFREMRGYTVRELARKTFIAPSTITKWENGHTVPNLDGLITIAAALNVKPENLYTIQNDKI